MPALGPSFGIAPALLVYQIVLGEFRNLGWMIAFVYLACGALRLARFNCISANHPSAGADEGLRLNMRYRPDQIAGIIRDMRYTAILEAQPDGGYHASCPALPGCHTQATSLDQLIERIKEAIALYLEVEGEDPESLDFVGVQQVTVGP